MGRGPEEILILLIIDIPSIVSAAGELMEARGLFRLEIVEFGFCVFGIPADGQTKQTEQETERI